MARTEYCDDEWADGADEGAAGDQDSSADLLACPSCGSPVHEETQQCPHCGDWIIPVWPRKQSRRLLWIAIVALLILSLVFLTAR